MYADSETPADIDFDCIPFSVAFHPGANIVAVGLVSGQISVHQYGIGEGENSKLHLLNQFNSACRDLRFSPDGQHLFAVSSDQIIRGLDIQNRKVAFEQPRAHKHPINKIHFLRNDAFVTGDDDGNIMLWDIREHRRPVATFSENADLISGFAFKEEEATLLAASGDGYMSIFDLRKMKTKDVTSHCSEMTSVILLQDGQSVACSATNGTIFLFQWGHWSSPCGKLAGHPHEVTCLLPISATDMLTADSDGVVRAVRMFPQPALLAAAAEYEDSEIEAMAISHDGRFVGCVAHDNRLHWLDIAAIQQSAQASTGDSSFFCEAVEYREKKRGRHQEVADMDEEDAEGEEAEGSDDEDEDEDDMEDDAPAKRMKSSTLALDKRQIKHREFFKGLL